MAQENPETDEIKGTEFDSVVVSLVQSGDDKKPTSPVQSVGPRMSAAEVINKPLSTADDLVRQASNTSMVAGSCLVVDLFVQQFCVSYPNDSSCLFK